MSSFDESGMATRPVDLRVEYEPTPANIDPLSRPRFSWRCETVRRGGHQIAFRLVLGRDYDAVAAGQGGMWDTGRVDSSTSTNVEYAGPQLGSDETYYWSVKVWTEVGETEWAEPAQFSTALRPEEWRGDWISHQLGEGDTNGWRSQWLDPEGGTQPWVQVDLGDRHDISKVALHPAEPVDIVTTPDDVAVTMSWTDNPLDGFGFPDRYRIEVADAPGFEDATVIAQERIELEEEEPRPGEERPDGVDLRVHEGIDAGGRYVRVTAFDLFEFSPGDETFSHSQEVEKKVEEYRTWRCFALAGITIENDAGVDIAEGCTVSASSSVETRTWGHRQLVNGHDHSRMACSSPQLRTEFDIDKPVHAARIHVAAVGYGELHVNGERVGERELDPAWTDYENRVLYSSYDIERHLTKGRNAIGLWLGRGRFSKSSSYWLADGSPRARAVLTLRFADGTTRTLSTDGNWQSAESPIQANDIYDGETYDARAEQDGWDEPRFDAGWQNAVVVDAPGGTLRPQRIQPMRVVDTLEVTDVYDHPDGPILDFGQNLTGWLEIRIEGASEGDEITIRHAEALTEDGDLSTADLRSADATDTYIARGADIEIYEPRFTYHGFRYAQVSGYPVEFDPDCITAKVVHSAMEKRGEFACSDDDLEQVQHNAVWGLRGNAHSIPEDCPQRDERFGWTGDAHIAARALFFNFDASRFHEKWIRDHDDCASETGYVQDVVPNKTQEDIGDPTWTITRVMIPWYLYLHDGDTRILREQYEGMRDYVDYWYSVTEAGIVPAAYGKFGDWLTFENSDGPRGLPLDLFNTAFLYQVINTFGKIANVLGNGSDAESYQQRADEVREAFNREFFDPERGVYGPGTQSSYSVPLFLGLVPKEKVDLVAENLAEKVRDDGKKLQTGFLGTRPLLHTLDRHGYSDLAYDIVSRTEQPGWVYMARNGATTMWERWDSDESVGSGMNSLNHSPFTHVSEFFYEVLAGIRIGDTPVTQRVTIAPSFVTDLDWVSARIETWRGDLAVEWEQPADGYTLTVTVPWNTQATVRLPDTAIGSAVESGNVLSEGTADGIRSVEERGDDLIVTVGAGEYEFATR